MEVQRLTRPNSIFIPRNKPSPSIFENAIVIEEVDDSDETSSDEDDLLHCAKGSERIGPDKVWSIIDNMSSRTALPKGLCREVPMHLAMTGTVISTGGTISLSTKEELLRKIFDMNGTVSSSVNLNISHVIASFGVNEKVMKARSLGIPVMRVEWIQAVWDACRADPYCHASHEQFNSYLCPLFHNVQFGLSRMIPKEVAKSLRSNITANGGQICSKLQAKQSVYITTSSMDPFYLTAKHLCIPIVSPSWVFSCAISKTLENIKFYEISSTNWTHL